MLRFSFVPEVWPCYASSPGTPIRYVSNVHRIAHRDAHHDTSTTYRIACRYPPTLHQYRLAHSPVLILSEQIGTSLHFISTGHTIAPYRLSHRSKVPSYLLFLSCGLAL
eukprot:3053341-Rhodomonas_salina.3